jgi:hypothetical protein
VSASSKPKKKWGRLAVHVIVLLAIAWGVRRTIVAALEDVENFHWQLAPLWLLASAGLYLLGMLPMGLFWYRALRALGQHPGLLETLRAFYIGHLGKYVPGKALVIVIRAGLIRSERVNTGVAAASVFLETMTMMAVGAFLAAAMMIVWLPSQLSDYSHFVPLAVGLMLLAGIPTLPPIFRRAVIMMGVGRSDPEIKEKLRGLTFGLMAYGWITVAGGWVLLAWSLWAVLESMGIDRALPIGHLDFYITAVGMAIVAGFLSLIPGGAGVREFILLAIMGNVYFGAILNERIAESKALVLAVLLRLAWLGAELLVAAVLYFGFRRRSVRAVVN